MEKEKNLSGPMYIGGIFHGIMISAAFAMVVAAMRADSNEIRLQSCVGPNAVSQTIESNVPMSPVGPS